MRSNAKLALAAVIGAAAGLLLSRRRRPVEAPQAAADRRAEELRAKLAEARAAAADEDDFEAAGMGAETLVEEPAEPAPAAVEPAPEPAPEPEPEPEEKPEQPKMPAAEERPPADEFEAMRRRIHEEGRSAAEEMRRSAEKPDDA